MKVLVTGGAGFIGCHLTDLLIKRGDQVSVIDNISTGNIDNLSHLFDSNQLKLYIDSVCNPTIMEDLIRDADHVYHLAAPVGVKYIMEHPVLTILDNVRGADVVLGLCNKYRKKIFMASTSEVYGRNLDYLGNEASKLGENDFRLSGSTKNHRWAYANTKSMDEFLSFAYYKEFKLPVVITRFFNTVGPKQTGMYGMVIPTFVKQALKGENITIYGDGKQSRCFLHVSDALRAITTLMDTPEAIGDVFNVGNEQEVNINQLATRIIEKTGSKVKLVQISYKEAYGEGFEDMMRRTPDITKINKLIGFKPEYDLDMILDDIIAHYKKQLNL